MYFMYHMLLGMLSKAKGQILCVAACLNMLFVEKESWTSIPVLIEDKVLAAAENFVDVCCQHADYLAGREDIIDKEVEKAVTLYKKQNGTQVHCSTSKHCCQFL